MAEVGDIVGHLKIDLSDWQRGLQTAQQQLAQVQSILCNKVFLVRPGRSGSPWQMWVRLRPRWARNCVLLGQSATQIGQQVQQAALAAAAGLQQAQTAAQGLGSVWQTALSVAGGIGIATTIAGIANGLKSLATEAIQALRAWKPPGTVYRPSGGCAGSHYAPKSLSHGPAPRRRVWYTGNQLSRFDAATQGTTLEGAKAQRVFEQITTGMRAMGSSSEQVGRALMALQQMVCKGIVCQEELRQQLSEALPGNIIAARAFGVTTQEMNKMIEKGMEATWFVQTFANQVEREFAGKATTATNTLASAWQRFGNELEQFKGALAGGDWSDQLRDLANWAASFSPPCARPVELQQERMGGAAPAIPPEMARTAHP